MPKTDPFALLKIASAHFPPDVRRKVLREILQRPTTRRVSNLLQKASGTPMPSQAHHDTDHKKRKTNDLNCPDDVAVTPLAAPSTEMETTDPPSPTTTAPLDIGTKRIRSESTSDPSDPNAVKPNKTPIFVKGVVHTRAFLREITTLLGAEIRASIRGDTLQLVPATPEYFRKTISFLRGKSGIEFYTYSLPEDRTVRLIVKNLGRNMPPDDVRDELLDLGFPIQHVSQLSSRRRSEGDKTSTLLPHFVVSVSRGPKVAQLRDLTRLCGLLVKVENFTPPKEPTQCRRCQRWGHTQRYCGFTPRCSKCCGPHPPKECAAPPGQPSCCNCGGPHTATYRGCPKWKEAKADQSRRTAGTRPPRTTPTTTAKPADALTQDQKDLGPSWSHVVKGGRTIRATATSQPPMPDNPYTAPTTQQVPSTLVLPVTETPAIPTPITCPTPTPAPHLSPPTTPILTPQPESTIHLNGLLPMLSILPEANMLELASVLLEKFEKLPPHGPKRTLEVLKTVIIYITYGSTTPSK